MLRLPFLTLWFAATSILSVGAAADDEKSRNNTIAGTFILECGSPNVLTSIAEVIRKQGGQVRREFNSDIFYGLSIRVANMTNAQHKMQKLKGVKAVWPVQVMEHSAEYEAEKQQLGVLGRRGMDIGAEPPWNHALTHVDELHKEGLSGKGIKIGIIDTGVNYSLPAFGGCFGKNCRVAFGTNLASDGKKGDPSDCHGHGTKVASILAGYDKAGGFVGAAPNATLGVYRVLNCRAEMEEDNLVQAWLEAYNDGMDIIVSSAGFQGQNWAQSPAAITASRIATKGVPCVVGLGNYRNEGLFNAMNPATGRGVIAVNSFARNPVILDQKGTYSMDGRGTGTIASLSAYGPTWDLDIKPSIGAPGQGVPVMSQKGRKENGSGTSFAGPLVGGILALVAEARKTSNSSLLNSILISTARPQKDNHGAFTVAQQGGGLVHAWDAAHATTLIEPATLPFNDTDHRIQTISLSIRNTARMEVIYQLSHIAATTLYTLQSNSLRPTLGEPVTAGADITFSRSSITLGAGQTASVDISVNDPTGLDPKRLPIWSGWVAINGSDGKALTVPYLGVAGSMRAATILTPTSVAINLADGSGRSLKENQTILLKDPPLGHRPGPFYVMPTPPNRVSGRILDFVFDPALGTPQMRVDIVPLDICLSTNDTRPLTVLPSIMNKRIPDMSQACIPETSVTEFGGLRTIGQYPGFPKSYIRGEKIKSTWTGELASGKYVPPGRYKLVARALSILGDANNVSHWQTTESQIFTVAYVHNLIVAKPSP